MQMVLFIQALYYLRHCPGGGGHKSWGEGAGRRYLYLWNKWYRLNITDRRNVQFVPRCYLPRVWNTASCLFQVLHMAHWKALIGGDRDRCQLALHIHMLDSVSPSRNSLWETSQLHITDKVITTPGPYISLMNSAKYLKKTSEHIYRNSCGIYDRKEYFSTHFMSFNLFCEHYHN